MYRELNTGSRRKVSEAEFAKAYRDGAETATLRSVAGQDPGDAEERDSSTVVPVPVTARTVAFGTVEDDLVLPYADGGIAWDPSLVFPGLSTGEHLESRVELAPRAPILAADGEALAEGPAEAREHPLGSAMIDVTGEIGMAEEDELPALARHGFPPGTPVGISGVEQAFNARLAGTAGRHPAGGRRYRRLGPDHRQGHPGGGRPGEDDDRPGPAGGRRLRARRPRRRGRRPRSPDRRRPRARRPGLLRPAAARLDIQDADHDRRPPEGGRLARRRIRNHRRRQRRRPLHQQRQRRALRRHLPRSVRRVLQRRLRPARAQDRQRRLRRGRGNVRVQLTAEPLLAGSAGSGRTGRTDDPDRHRRRSRPRGDGDRPGRSAGDAVDDGEHRPGDRQRRHPRADLAGRQQETAARQRSRSG